MKLLLVYGRMTRLSELMKKVRRNWEMRMVACSRRSGSWRVTERPSGEMVGLPTLQRRQKLCCCCFWVMENSVVYTRWVSFYKISPKHDFWRFKGIQNIYSQIRLEIASIPRQLRGHIPRVLFVINEQVPRQVQWETIPSNTEGAKADIVDFLPHLESECMDREGSRR